MRRRLLVSFLLILATAAPVSASRDFDCDVEGTRGRDTLSGGGVVCGKQGDDTISTRNGQTGDVALGGRGVDHCSVDEGDHAQCERVHWTPGPS